MDITVTTDNVAMYVVFTTGAQGRFSKNAFTLLPPGETIKFHPFLGFDIDVLRTTLRVEHLAMYK